jgi:DNA polymerase-3 subunit delta'
MLFKEIIGQENTKERLIRSVKEQRISHAQLFLGPQGSGALPIALAYAQYVSCTNRTADDSCGICLSCIKYNKLIHPDLHFVFPIALSKENRKSDDLINEFRELFLSNPYITLFDWFEELNAENKQAVIGTEESAEILRKLSLTTYESAYKIMIVWLPEKMNTTAANKLLKILEEPPDKTLFLLVCENEDQLLRTIVSRTQLIKINKLTDEEVAQALIEKKQLSAEDAQKMAHLADGNFSEALLLVSDIENNSQNFINFQSLMRNCLKFNIKEVVSWTNTISEAGRERQKSFITYSLHIIRQCFLVNSGGETLVKLTEKELEFVKKFAAFIHSNNIEPFTEELNKAYYHLERNANPKMLFTDLAFKFNELLNVPKPVATTT